MWLARLCGFVYLKCGRNDQEVGLMYRGIAWEWDEFKVYKEVEDDRAGHSGA